MNVSDHLLECEKCKGLKFKKDTYVTIFKDKDYLEERKYVRYICSKCGTFLIEKEV